MFIYKLVFFPIKIPGIATLGYMRSLALTTKGNDPTMYTKCINRCEFNSELSWEGLCDRLMRKRNLHCGLFNTDSLKLEMEIFMTGNC